MRKLTVMAGLAAAAAASLAMPAFSSAHDTPQRIPPRVRKVDESRQRARYLQRQARKRQRHK